MLIGVFSDTHDHMDNIRKAIALFESRGIDTAIHAGDIVAPFAAKAIRDFKGTIYAVFGNNDGEHKGLSGVLDIVDPPRRLEIAGRVILVAHDTTEFPDPIPDDVDVAISGHTHESVATQGRPVMINPGEAGGWLHGRATCMILDLETLQGEVCDL